MGCIKEYFKRVVLREFVAQASYLRTCPCCKKKGIDSACEYLGAPAGGAVIGAVYGYYSPYSIDASC